MVPSLHVPGAICGSLKHEVVTLAGLEDEPRWYLVGADYGTTDVSTLCVYLEDGPNITYFSSQSGGVSDLEECLILQHQGGLPVLKADRDHGEEPHLAAGRELSQFILRRRTLIAAAGGHEKEKPEADLHRSTHSASSGSLMGG